MPPQSRVEDASREFWNCVCSQRPPSGTQNLSRFLHLLIRRARFRYHSCRLSITSTFVCVLCEATFTWMYSAVCHDVRVKCHRSGACVGKMRHRRCTPHVLSWTFGEQFAVINFAMHSISWERRGLNPGSADKTLFNVLTVHVFFFAEGPRGTGKHWWGFHCKWSHVVLVIKHSLNKTFFPGTVETWRKGTSRQHEVGSRFGPFGLDLARVLVAFSRVQQQLVNAKNYIFLDFRSTMKFSGRDAAPPKRRREDHHWNSSHLALTLPGNAAHESRNQCGNAASWLADFVFFFFEKSRTLTCCLLRCDCEVTSWLFATLAFRSAGLLACGLIGWIACWSGGFRISLACYMHEGGGERDPVSEVSSRDMRRADSWVHRFSDTRSEMRNLEQSWPLGTHDV